MTIQDINTRTRFLCSATTTSYTAAQLLIEINAAYEEVVAWILGADGKWNFDDTNYTTFPEATTTLVASQNDYSFDVSHLEILRVEIKDTSGNWSTLSPIDRLETSEPLTELFPTAGLPQYYDKDGSSIVIYPAPSASSVTLTNGLKVYFKRTASVFTSAEVTTGTKLPGFASPFHEILSYMAAIPYCSIYKQERVPMLMGRVEQIKKELIKFYGHRELDRRKFIAPAGISYQ